MSTQWDSNWDPKAIMLNDPNVDRSWKLCVLQKVILDESSGEFSGLGGRIAAIFTIFITSMLATLVPVLARNSSRVHIPELVYIVAKNFGTGVIIATALIHLIDPALVSMGQNSCVGSSDPWAGYPWCATFMLFGAVLTFVVDVYTQHFSEKWYGKEHEHSHGGEFFLDAKEKEAISTHAHPTPITIDIENNPEKLPAADPANPPVVAEEKEQVSHEFASEFSRFLILEIGVIVHSVFIGLSLGSSDDWVVLFVVIIFHQAFEGLGIGARMSMIPFPKSKRWWQYLLSFAYSVTTPVSIAFGILARNSYRDNGFSQMLVQGICDAFSCGIMLYTGFVELLAREFIFCDHSTRTLREQNEQIFSIVLGAGLMSVIGKWA